MTLAGLPEDASKGALSIQLENLQGLLSLAMLMIETNEEHRILQLAATSVPSLANCGLYGAYLEEEGWRSVAGPCTDVSVRSELESQLAVLSRAGGEVAVRHAVWGWAFPLRSSEGHFGFLVVGADRTPTDSGHFLVRILAQQTGIALAKARLHARHRETAEELRGANRALTSTVVALERSQAIHARLTQVTVAGEGLEGIAATAHELTGYPIAVEDRYGNLMAWAGPGQPAPYPKGVPTERAAMMRRVMSEGKPLRADGRLVVAFRAETGIGLLAIVNPGDTAGEEARVVLEHAATVLSIEFARLRALADTEIRLRRDIVDDLLSGTDEESALARTRALAYDLDRPHRVIVIEGGSDTHDDRGFFDVVRRMAHDTGVGELTTARRGAVVVLSDVERGWEMLRTAVLNELTGGSCRIGVGGVVRSVAGFPRSYREALFAIKMQTTYGRGDRATAFEDLGVYRIFADVAHLNRVEGFVREWLGALLDYDSSRGSELVQTLSRYHECGGNYDATAKALTIHRSTLKYRLQRIKQISGHDLTDPETHFNLQLATRAWQTLLALKAGASD